MLRIVILLGVLGFIGCAQQKANEKPSVDKSYAAGFMYSVNAARVSDGMSEVDVVALMGTSPSSRSTVNTVEGVVKVLGWSHYYVATRKSYSVEFQFLNDKVNGRSERGL